MSSQGNVIPGSSSHRAVQALGDATHAPGSICAHISQMPSTQHNVPGTATGSCRGCS